ncbi:phosphotransferase [Pseudonocardia sp. CA-107938]|uniref:phosphotransferase n=1 Tax=Pseudonocardia sp. CA-107938 TaxID=3240021 RepID=UPI003D8A1761
MDLGEPLASGRTAHVYGIDAERVLRRDHVEIDAGRVAREVAYMRHAAAHGIPVPHVFDADGRDIVMERITGPDLRAAFHAGRLGLADVARHVTDLLGRLRHVPGLRGQQLVHLDLHPENVLLGAAGPVLIDWANAGDGDPDLDAALALLVVAEVAVAPGAEAALRELVMLTAAGISGDPLRCLDEALGRRLANRTLGAAEKARLPTAGELVRAALLAR